jgi:outer membrane protein
MTPIAARFFFVLLLGAAPAADAQSDASHQPPAQEPAPRDGAPADADRLMPRGVSLGVAVIWSEGRLVGEDTRSFVVPTIGYEGERLFFRGINGGVHLFKRDGFEVDAIVAARLDGWDAKDLDAGLLADAGIDRALLCDRDTGVDAGFGASLRTKAGKFSVEAKGDVSSASGGYEVALDYRASFPFARGILSPRAGISYWSADLSDYYYGTLPQEEALGVPRYRPGSTLVPNIGLSYLRPLPRGWLLVGGVEVRWLGSDITDSPLVDDDSGRVPSVFIGISRAFGSRR